MRTDVRQQVVPARFRRVRRSGLPSLVALLIVLVVFGNASHAFDPAELLAQVRSTQLRPDAAVALHDVALDIGPARLDILNGVVIPAVTADGVTVELIFQGQARFRLEPPDDIEAAQLELFTGRAALDAPISEAVFVMARVEVVESLLDRPAPRDVPQSTLERAAEIHAEWLLRSERRSTGVEASIFRFLIGDEAYRDYFALWANSYEVGQFVYQLDPEDVEQITVARFTPIDIRGWDRRRLQRHIRLEQRKGRWLGVRIQDLGAWDVWLSTSWSPGEDSTAPGADGFEPWHYNVDLTLRHDGLKVEGTAAIDVRAEVGGRRTLTLNLFRDLRVEQVRIGEGDALFFFRSGDEVVVYLPESHEAGETFRLQVTYAGRVAKWVGQGTFDLEHTSDWHPHLGTIDRATYDVTLRWPKKYHLISSGRLVDQGRQGRRLWQRRVIDQPATGFSFALGKFLLERRQIGHVELSIAFSRAAPVRLTAETMERAIDTIARSLTFFEQVFGDYPLDELAVVVMPRRYSQSYLGFITLTDSILYTPELYSKFDADAFRDTLVAHEVAHQWWGNKVGWWSYRDQWLSEATANYASLLFYSHQQGEGSTYLADMSAGWRETLSRRTADGRAVESLGPIVLGGRLNSSLSSSAYHQIVYRKGAVVLAMLARAVGEEAFVQMLRELADAATHRVLTTEMFVKSIERMSGLDLTGFARQFIYGTGIPDVYYSYDASANGDGWIVRGQARRVADSDYDVVAARVPTGGWDVARVVRDGAADEITSTIMVPSRIVFDQSESGGPYSVTRIRGRWQNLLLDGRAERFEIQTDEEPIELQLDPRGEVLARFYSREAYPKRCARFDADDLIARGRLEDAERAYRKALVTEAGKREVAGRTSYRDHSFDVQVEDALIRLSLARLYLDSGRIDEAREELEQTDGVLASDKQLFRMQRDVLWSRADLLVGNYEGIYKRLRKTLRAALPQADARTWRRLLFRMQLASEREALTEAFVLLAVASLETGHRNEYSWAVREGRDRGADVRQLEIAAESSARRPN